MSLTVTGPVRRLSGSWSCVYRITMERRGGNSRCFRRIRKMKRLLFAIGAALVALAAIGKAAEKREEKAAANTEDKT